MQQGERPLSQKNISESPLRIFTVTAYPQLKELWDDSYPEKEGCSLIDVPLEEGNLPESIGIPEANGIEILLPNDVRSHLLLRYIAKIFDGHITVIPIKGEYTSIAPLAVSGEELKNCCRNCYVISDDKRKALCTDWEKIEQSRDCCFQLIEGTILPLPNYEVYEHIYGLLVGEMKMTYIVGRCMGTAPNGWPLTDVFYLNRIEELIERRYIIVSKDNENPFERYVRLR